MFDTKYNEPADYERYKNQVKYLYKRVNALVAFLELEEVEQEEIGFRKKEDFMKTMRAAK